METSYAKAQMAISNLKAAIYEVLLESSDGMTNAQLGRSLGIYVGHKRHEGHISRTILALMEVEEVVKQDPTTKIWTLKER